MQEQFRRFIIQQLRLGTSVSDVMEMLQTLHTELTMAESYLSAIEESNFRP